MFVVVVSSVWCSQGLRTLELCVDNLQPEFLYNHIQPVRAELMQVTPVNCNLSCSVKLLLFWQNFL